MKRLRQKDYLISEVRKTYISAVKKKIYSLQKIKIKNLFYIKSWDIIINDSEKTYCPY